MVIESFEKEWEKERKSENGICHENYFFFSFFLCARTRQEKRKKMSLELPPNGDDKQIDFFFRPGH